MYGLGVRKHRAPKGALRLVVVAANADTHIARVRKHRAPKGELRLVKHTVLYTRFICVRKHRAPKGALRRGGIDDLERNAHERQKAPSAKRCIKTRIRIAAKTHRKRQKAPSTKRCIKTVVPLPRLTDEEVVGQKAASAKRCIKTEKYPGEYKRWRCQVR